MSATVERNDGDLPFAAPERDDAAGAWIRSLAEHGVTASPVTAGRRISVRMSCPICKTTQNGSGPPVTFHLVEGLPITAHCGCPPARIRKWLIGMVRGGSVGKGDAIIANGRSLPDVVAEALKAINLANSPPVVFVRGGELVRVRTDEQGRPIVDLLVRRGHATAALRNLAADAAGYATINGKDGRVTWCAPPMDVVNGIVGLPAWPFPALEAVVQAPALRPDGSVLTAPGYDPPTRLLHIRDARLGVPAIPDKPQRADVAAAAAVLSDLVAEFPFVDDADRANALGILLTPIVRPAIDGPVPLAVLNGTRAGTGKNLLANLVAIIATGRTADVMSLPQDEAEWRKTIASTLDAGPALVVLDEAHDLRSAALASVLTTGSITDRRLGHTENLRALNRATWIACGNNVHVAGDLPRRCVWINLNARTARPWQRTFRIADLEAHAIEHRGELLAASLTLARAWYAAGSPAATVPTIGGFQSWATTIGGILAHAGVAGFLANAGQSYDRADHDATQWEGWLRVLGDAYGQTSFTAGQVLEALRDGTTPLAESLPDDLADKLARRTLTKAALGRALGAKADTYHGDDGIRVTKAAVSARSGVATWQIIHSAEQQRAHSESPPSRAQARTHEGGQMSSAPSVAMQAGEGER